MIQTALHSAPLPQPIDTLERHFRDGGVSLIRAVFENTFFATPHSVRARTPYFPEHARKSREHYPGLEKGASETWLDSPVRLDDNSRAQMAWAKYSGRAIARGSGYGVRHVWGNPWNPIGFTAGWNLAYMPFWAGMLTEDQHPHAEVQRAIKQASWDLYFRNDPVCATPDFVTDPGMDLAALLAGQPVLLLEAEPEEGGTTKRAAAIAAAGSEAAGIVKAIRTQSNASWSNLKKAALQRQGLPHDPFGTINVERSSRSHINGMLQATGLDIGELSVLLDELS